MRVTCVTSRYLPNLWHIVRVLSVDRAVILDLAPLPDRNRDSFVTRNRIWNETALTPQWLTAPVLRRRGQSVKDVQINPTEKRWVISHTHALEHCYPRHEKIAPGFLANLQSRLQGQASLLELNLSVLRFLLEVLSPGSPFPYLESSILPSHGPNHRLEAAQFLRASQYVAGSVEWNLMTASAQAQLFVDAGIEVIQSLAPVSHQHETDSIIYFSSVHCICTRGVSATRELLERLVLMARTSFVAD